MLSPRYDLGLASVLLLQLPEFLLRLDVANHRPHSFALMMISFVVLLSTESVRFSLIVGSRGRQVCKIFQTVSFFTLSQL